jgi:hypothetical protein
MKEHQESVNTSRSLVIPLRDIQDSQNSSNNVLVFLVKEIILVLFNYHLVSLSQQCTRNVWNSY